MLSNTLKHTVPHATSVVNNTDALRGKGDSAARSATHYNTLQRTATHSMSVVDNNDALRRRGTRQHAPRRLIQPVMCSSPLLTLAPTPPPRLELVRLHQRPSAHVRVYVTGRTVLQCVAELVAEKLSLHHFCTQTRACVLPSGAVCW